jgi:formate dehydrogenase major subunit
MSDRGLLDRIRDALGLIPASLDRPPRTRGAEVKRTVCCFCSCGCGMLAQVRDGKLLSLEGDPANPINEGTLCAKGAAARELHASPERLTRPMRRAPGQQSFEPITWDAALDAIARKIHAVRNATWIEDAQRTDGLGFLGGAINTNEETYLYRKMATVLGCHAIEHQARI